jgi:hypothetical protein
MPEQSPLTQGLIPPLLRGMAPNHGARKPMTQSQGMHLLRSTVEFVKRKVPRLHITITDGLGNMTIYVEMTNGGP